MPGQPDRRRGTPLPVGLLAALLLIGCEGGNPTPSAAQTRTLPPPPPPAAPITMPAIRGDPRGDTGATIPAPRCC